MATYSFKKLVEKVKESLVQAKIKFNTKREAKYRTRKLARTHIKKHYRKLGIKHFGNFAPIKPLN